MTAFNEHEHPREMAGKFTAKSNSAPEISLGAFRFDRDYDNHEQVRSYFDDYMSVYRELESAGQYPYNDRFRGRIPGIEGPDEDSAIYMLQNLRSRDALKVQIDDLLEAGGREVSIDDVDKPIRGTVVQAGFYMGGTGYRSWESARLMRAGNGHQLAVLPKGKRTHGSILGEGRIFVLEQ